MPAEHQESGRGLAGRALCTQVSGGRSQVTGGPKGESALRGEFSEEMEGILSQGEGIGDRWCVFVRGWT